MARVVAAVSSSSSAGKGGLSLVQLRAIPGHGGFGLGQCVARWQRIDFEKQVALGYLAPLSKVYAQQQAGHLRFDLYGG